MSIDSVDTIDGTASVDGADNVDGAGRTAGLAVDRLELVRPVAAAVPATDEDGWFDGLAFKGPLDPGGTLFAFLLSLVATVALVVLVAGVVRAVGAA